MLGRKDYTKQELENARAAIGKQLRSVRDFARKEWPLRGSAADVLT